VVERPTSLNADVFDDRVVGPAENEVDAAVAVEDSPTKLLEL
jgi:hypothetical protein